MGWGRPVEEGREGEGRGEERVGERGGEGRGGGRDAKFLCMHAY